MSIYIIVAIIAFIAGLLVGGALFSISDSKETQLKLNNLLNSTIWNLIKNETISKEQAQLIDNLFREEIKHNFEIK